MHIVVITGSPHRNGTTAALADLLSKGRGRRDTTFFVLMRQKEKKYPPVWPVSIAGQRGSCIHDDGMQELLPVLEQAENGRFRDTALLFLEMSAQLKKRCRPFFMRGSAALRGREGGDGFSLPPPYDDNELDYA